VAVVSLWGISIILRCAFLHLKNSKLTYYFSYGDIKLRNLIAIEKYNVLANAVPDGGGAPEHHF